MFFVMLHLRFKTLCIVFSLINYEQGKAIVEECDIYFLFPLLLKCHYDFNILVESKRGIVDQRFEEDNSLDIFEMTISKNEPTTKLINKKFLIFKRYEVDAKNIKCPLQWWEKHENMFPTIGFYVKKNPRNNWIPN